MLKQNLQQRLLQKLSPQQLQFIKLLQVSTVMLDARIKEELEENPALEDISLIQHEEKEEYSFEDEEKEDFKEESTDNSDEFSIEDYLQDDSEKDYATSMAYDSDDEEEKKELPYAQSSSFYETLQFQLNLIALDDKDFLIAQQIIGSLDDDGYLRRSLISLSDDLAFAQNIDAT